MVRKKNFRPRKLSFRFLLMMTAFMLITFLIIAVSFNVLAGEYVRRDIADQLNSTIFELVNYDIAISFGNETYELRDIPANLRNFFRIDDDIYRSVTEILQNPKYASVSSVLYRDYTRLQPSSRFHYTDGLEEMDLFLSALKKNQNIAGSGDIARYSTEKGDYYYTNIDFDQLFGQLYGLDGLNLLLFVNTERYDYLTSNIKNMLILVLVAETLIMFVFVIFISRSITKPIEALSNFAVRLGKGDFTGQDFNFIDRELINLNNVMNDAARKLKANDEDQIAFFQNVSHELRTPLMSIKGYGEGIKYGVFRDEGELNESADVIISETDRLSALVEDLLYVSRMDAYKAVEITGDANLADVAAGCIEKLKGLFMSSGKTVNFEYPEYALIIMCDEKSLTRALINIISNAARYAKTKVDVSLRREGGQAILKIQDDGDGIDENDLPNIYKRFYKGKSGKYGIGLSIAKTILDHHNADIKAENNETGALFTVEFILKNIY